MPQANFPVHCAPRHPKVSALFSRIERLFDKPQGTNGKECAQQDLEWQVSEGQGDVHSPNTARDKLKIIDLVNLKVTNPRVMIGQGIRPLLYLQFPVVVFCGISVGCYQMWLSFLNGTESSVMTDSYGLSVVMLGVPYVSPIIAAVLG